MVPNRLAIALQDDGWWVRSEIIWHKPNPMPESVTDRPASAHEKVWLLSKSARYFYDSEAVKVPAKWPDGPNAPDKIKSPHGQGFTRRAKEWPGSWGRAKQASPTDQRSGNYKAPVDQTTANLRNVWTIPTKGFSGAHFATFPPALVEPCIKAGTSEKGCCAGCGAPWVREVDATKPDRASREPRAKAITSPRQDGNSWNENDGRGFIPVETTTTGWSPSCACDVHPIIPCTVVDPFIGSGTTAMVADRLGRDCIGIELNPANVEMARDRLQDDAGMFAEVAAQ
jgi:DNA modification methylase